MKNDKNTDRCFIALRISDEIRKNLTLCQTRLKDGDNVSFKCVNSKNIHLTLLFLGDVLKTSIPDIEDTIDEAAKNFGCFEFSADGIDFFGRKARPRIIWAGIRNGRDELIQLQNRLAIAMRGIGMMVEDRTYTPHITLGRIRSMRKAEELIKRMSAENESRFGTVQCKEVLLFRSILRPNGAEHIVLHRTELS